jgi:nucleoside-diphosphate-sugar epimerase
MSPEGDSPRVMFFMVSSQSDSGLVVVTGASGALGSSIVERFQNEGMRLRAFMRREPVRTIERMEVQLGDLGDPHAVKRVVAGAHVVVHAGAATKGGWEDHCRATIAGTKNVVDACEFHGVKKLIHISSLSVVDWISGAPDIPIDETTQYEPYAADRGFYTQAKLEAERIVVSSASRGLINATILRPGQIFGGRIPLLTAAVARKYGRWRFVLGDGGVQLPLVYIDDVVDSIFLSVTGDLNNGQIIHIVDDMAMTQNEVLRMVEPGTKVIHIPKGLLLTTGRWSMKLAGLIGKSSPMSTYRLRSALANRRFVSLYAPSALGWTPRIGVLEGIRRISN